MTNLDTSTSALHLWPHQPPAEPPTRGYHDAAGPPAPLPPGPGTGFPSSPGGPGNGAGPTPLPPRPGGSARRSLLLTAAVISVIGLLAAAFLLGSRAGRTDEAASANPSTTTSAPPTTVPRSTVPANPPSTSAPPSTTSPSPGSRGGASSPVDATAVKAEVAELSRFVEQDRGLEFKNEVEVTVLAPDAFKTRVLQEFDKETDRLREQGRFYQALGIIDANADPVKVQKDLLGEGVLGFYDPKTKVLVVKGEKIGPFFRRIVVHELTHAIDDQNFGLDRPEIDKRTDGSEWAWLALVEGDARRVEYDYVRQLSSADKATLLEEMMSLGGGPEAAPGGLDAMGDLPLTLIFLIQSPYDYGEPFVRDVLQRHGQAGVDRAFSDPPTTSEQILQPEKYETRETARGVTKPPAEGEQVGEGSLGELMTNYVATGQLSMEDMYDKILGGLDPNDPNGGLGGLEGILGGLGGNTDDPTKMDTLLQDMFGKADKIKNWGGDHYVMYKTGSQLCVRVDWTMDSAADTQTLRSELAKGAADDASRKIENQGDTTRMTRCISDNSPSGGGGGGNSPSTDPGKAG